MSSHKEMSSLCSSMDHPNFKAISLIGSSHGLSLEGSKEEMRHMRQSNSTLRDMISRMRPACMKSLDTSSALGAILGSTVTMISNI